MSNTCGQYKAVDGTDKRRKTRQFHFLMRSLIQLLSQNLFTTMFMSHIQVIHFLNQNTSSTKFPILRQAMCDIISDRHAPTPCDTSCVQKIPILCGCGSLQLKFNPLLVNTCTICSQVMYGTGHYTIWHEIPILCGCANLHKYLSPACTLDSRV